MDNVYVGRLVTTHGIKGEVKISSNFERKDKVFCIGNELIINNRSYIITSYRVHQKYDMVTFEGINDINVVIPLKGSKVYVRRDSLELSNDDYLLDDLLNMEVKLNEESVGIVSDVSNGANALLEVDGNKTFYIPLKGDFIDQVDTTNNIIYVNDSVKGLML